MPTILIASFVYAFAMTLANLSIYQFGPWISPINSFLFIGLDLALRDWLHIKVDKKTMVYLIAVSGLLTYFLNPSASNFAIASAISFSLAALVDFAVFDRVKKSMIFRANASNVAGAAVDSLVFPTLAFGVLMPHIVALQFVAKVFGGFLWSYLLFSKKVLDKSTK